MSTARVLPRQQAVDFVWANGRIGVSRPVRGAGTALRDTVFLDEDDWNRLVDFVAKHWTMRGNGKVDP